MSKAKPAYLGEELTLVNGELVPMEAKENDDAVAADDAVKTDAQEGRAGSAPPFRYFYKE